MRHLLLTAALCVIALPAVAGQCPADMGEIDAALETASLSPEQMADVKALRAQGEAEHQSGDHAASVATLAKAKEILGL